MGSFQYLYAREPSCFSFFDNKQPAVQMIAENILKNGRYGQRSFTHTEHEYTRIGVKIVCLAFNGKNIAVAPHFGVCARSRDSTRQRSLKDIKGMTP